MNPHLLIPLSVVLFALSGTMTRLFQLRLQKSGRSVILYQACYCALGALLYLSQAKRPVSGTVYTFGMASAFGVFFFLAVYCSAKCYETGSMAVSSIVFNLSFIIPTAYSWIMLSEKIYAKSIAGLVLLALTFALSSRASKGRDKKASWKWLAFLFVGFVSNGITAVIQKRFQINMDGENSGAFMFVAYMTTALIFAAVFVLASPQARAAEEHGLRGHVKSVPCFIAVSLLAGTGSFAGNGILMYLSSRVNGGILYPALNGGLSLLLCLVSVVFFRERLTVRKTVSVICGVLAIMTLSI